jgi:hypothetical protein
VRTENVARSEPTGDAWQSETVVQAMAMVRTGAAQSKIDPGSVTVELGWAQFGAQSRSN